ncbi:MAG: dTDP-4-dehydrorhamnose reductase [Ferruginibacter sp.]
MTSKKNILVTGANGQLGMEFRQLESLFTDYRFLFVSKDELSITDKAAFEKYFTDHNIDYCINCAAYTAVDKAETEKEVAVEINVTAVGHLAAICKKNNSTLIHFSTDYVFDGTTKIPYSENSLTNPVNFYGQTKLDGEGLALNNNENTLIIRTSWVYSSHGKNFVTTMLRLMCEKESVGVVDDQFGCPTYAAQLAVAVMTIINSSKTATGTYHYCNEGIISWYDFACEIKKLINSKCVVNAISTSSYPTPAKRPHFSALDTQKIQADYQLQIPAWKLGLADCIKLMTL